MTSVTEDPEVLEHIEAIEEKPKNSNYRSRQSTAARCGQRSILHRFLTSLKEPFQCVRITTTTAAPNQMVGDVAEDSNGNEGRITTTIAV
ncbi:hypothetical protein Q3G72_029252 [Acer saccharum]|nr:hypothetical protein Q3G72_029252 [Acer saccharum]